MDTSILDLISKLAPILSGMASSSATNQDKNAVIGNNSAAARPGMVGQNLTNSMRASMFGKNYTPVKFNWGGPGSVAKGDIPSVTGGPGPLSDDTMSLQDEVTKDALAQAKNNYGIKDPSESSVGSSILGGASSISSILAALANLKKPGGGLPTAGGGPGGPGGGGPDSFSGPTQTLDPSMGGVTSSSMTGPNGIVLTPEEIAQMIRSGGIPIGGKKPLSEGEDAGYI